MIHALFYFYTKSNTNKTSRCYQKIKIEKSKIQSDLMKGNNFFLNRKHSEETKLEFSKNRKGLNNSMFGKKHTKETKIKMKEKRKLQIFSEETKIKKSKSIIGNKNPNSKIFICIDPNNKKFIINGEIQKFCIENNFCYMTILRFLNKGKITKCRNKNYINWEFIQ